MATERPAGLTTLPKAGATQYTLDGIPSNSP